MPRKGIKRIFCEPGESVYCAARRRWGFSNPHLRVELSNLNGPREGEKLLGRVSVHRSGSPSFAVYAPVEVDPSEPDTETIYLYRESTVSGDGAPMLSGYTAMEAPRGVLGIGIGDQYDTIAPRIGARRISEVHPHPVTLYREVWTMPRGWNRDTAPIARRTELLGVYLHGAKVSE